jgi:hypothetical protein
MQANVRRARRNEACDYCGYPFDHLEVDGEPADLVTETELGVFCGRACYREATGQELLEYMRSELEGEL